MADTGPEGNEHLNAAQMAEVQRHLVAMVEKMQLRKWALEQCLKCGMPPAEVVKTAAAMTAFVEGK